MTNPRGVVNAYAGETTVLQAEIQAARDLLPQVTIPDDVAEQGLEIIEELKIDSLRAEITLFEAARAYAAADDRERVQDDDLSQVALLALRARRSSFMSEYFADQQVEEQEILSAIENTNNIQED
jgi:Mg-chelatase subunit ChlI